MTDAGEIRAVAYREGGKWVGQCLDYDIRVQADTVEQLMTNLEVALEATRADSMERHGRAFAHIEPAPVQFHALWDKHVSDVRPWKPRDRSPVTMALCA